MPYQFSFKADDYTQFKCPLKRSQCEHINRTGKQCRRQQYIGFNLCFQHLASDYHVKIKPSRIQGAGKGLFAYNGTDNNNAIVFTGTREKGERIVDYNADVLTSSELDRRYGDYTAPYAVRINKGLVEDASCRRSAGSLANHNSKANSKLYAYQGRVYLRATKNIKNGQEITVDYGDEYDLDEKGVSHTTKYVR